MWQLSFLSPRQSRSQKKLPFPRGLQDANGDGTFCVAEHPQAPSPTRDHSGTGGARGPTEAAAAAWKGNGDPRGDHGDSRGKRSILEKSERGRGRDGLPFSLGLITREELHWDQHLYEQMPCSVCGSWGTNPLPQAARSKIGDISSAGVWSTRSPQIHSFLRSFVIKAPYRKKKINSSTKSGNSKQKENSPSESFFPRAAAPFGQFGHHRSFSTGC